MKPYIVAAATLLLSGLNLISIEAIAQSSRSGVWDASSNSSSSSSTPSSSASSSNTANQYQSRAYQQRRGQYPYPANTGRYSQGQYRQAYPQTYQRGAYPQATSAGSRSYQAPATQTRGYSQTAAQPSRAAQISARNFRDAIESGGVRRTFTCHIPSSYDGSRPVPLVLAFHGLGMNGVAMEGLTLMDLTAERNGFIVVYPDGVGSRWNDGGSRGNNGMDDVGFTSDLINYLSKKYKIDPRHVHACGISNGGHFVQKLGCELSEKIASIGVISAAVTAWVCSSCHPRRSMPVVLFLGTDDPLVPREGETKQLGKLGEALGISGLANAGISSQVAKIGGLYSANDTTEFWSRINNCSSNPREERMPDRSPRDGCKVTRETYGGGSGGSEVVVYTVEGGGHNWPGGSGAVAQDVLGTTTFDISASDICWQFFQSHPR